MSETFNVSDRAIVKHVLQLAGAQQIPRGDIMQGFGKHPAVLLFLAPPPNRTSLSILVSEVDGKPIEEVVGLIKAKLASVNQEPYHAL